MHDQNQDGRICPIDVNIIAFMFCKDYSYLHWFDIDLMRDLLRHQITNIPEKEPGYHLKEFEKQFDEYWEAKKQGLRVKRKPLVFEDEPSQKNSVDRNKPAAKVTKNEMFDVFDKTAERKDQVENNGARVSYTLTKKQAMEMHSSP